jgi:adenylate cyclase, class 1
MQTAQQTLSNKDIRQRFLHLNEVRIGRARHVMGGKHQRALDLLPLLFHINHPQLPGFIDNLTPCGVYQFHANELAVQRAKQVAPSFQFNAQQQTQTDIDAIYLMGSSGSVAHSRQSDFDIWLCHRPGLSAQHIEALQAKANRITKWADQQGIEMYFFVMTAEQFRDNKRPGLSGEDCGSTQHKLLLDEFYRTALLLAGKPPLWWFIPPEREKDYSAIHDALTNDGQFKMGDVLDFGSVADIPFSEYIGAGVWQMYKSIDSPYKSMIKILLTETYASQHGSSEPLSMGFKKLIYQNQLHPDELDPYVMMYRRLERYLLAQANRERLEFIRRCFYTKISIPLSQFSRESINHWRQQLLRNLVDQWSWGDYQLMELDERNNWPIERVIQEQQLLVKELTHSYELLCDLAQQRNAKSAIDAREFSILGHKLQAWFEYRDNKVAILSSAINPCVVIDKLILSRTSQWHLLRPDHVQPIYSCASLYQLLCWAEANHLSNHLTQFYVDQSCGDLSPQDVQLLRRQMKGVLAFLDEPSNDEDFAAEEAMRGVLFIIDSHNQALSDDKMLVSDRNDVLKFGGASNNLLHEIDMLCCSSWHGLYHYHFNGSSSVIESLCFVLNNSIRHHQPPPRAIFFSQANHGTALVKRYQAIYQQLGDILIRAEQAPRFVLEIEQEYYVLEKMDGQIQWRHFPSRSKLFNYLGQERQEYSSIELDNGALRDTPLPALLPIFRPNIVQVFYQINAGMVAIYLDDEMGSFYTYYTQYHNPQALMQPLYRFLKNIRQRQHHQTQLDGERHVYFYEIQFHRKINRYIIDPLHADMDIEDTHHFEVQAHATRNAERAVVYDIHCGQREFLYAQWGESIYREVASYILQHRTSKEHYPCYLTDIDLNECTPSGTRLQTIVYLQHKQKIERLLNQALQASD